MTLSDWEGYFEAGRQTASPGRCQILLSSGIGRSDAEKKMTEIIRGEVDPSVKGCSVLIVCMDVIARNLSPIDIMVWHFLL